MTGSSQNVSAATLSEFGWDFLRARSLGTLSTIGRTGRVHVVPVGFVVGDDLTVEILTRSTSQKIANMRRRADVAVCQFEGRHWITLSGPAHEVHDAREVSEAEIRYAARYRRTPTPHPERVVVRLQVNAILGSSSMFAATP